MPPDPEAPPADVPAPPSSGLPAAVRDAPHRYGFHAVLRQFEAINRTRPRLGRSARPSQDTIRLGAGTLGGARPRVPGGI